MTHRPCLALGLAFAFVAVGPGSVSAAEMSCSWRLAAKSGPENPLGDSGLGWTAGQRITDSGWRAIDEHMQRYHFGLWTASELEALERSPGVVLAILQPMPESNDSLGRMSPPRELGAVQWPDRVPSSGLFLVAIGDADPGEDWLLRVTSEGQATEAPPLIGPVTATVNPDDSGFFRVHRLPTVAVSSSGANRALYRAERVPLNQFGLETSLRLNTVDTVLVANTPGAVVATGSYRVRTRDSDRLVAPVVVNLGLEGPGADLFGLEVLPLAGQVASTSSRNVRVDSELGFRIRAPASAALLGEVLPPGQELILEVHAEVVSFANAEGGDLDLGLSTVGFSSAPETIAYFPPARQLPLGVVHRSTELRLWRHRSEE